MSDAWLEKDQRERLIAYISEADQILGDERFSELPDNFGDCEIMALSLEAATLLGVPSDDLGRFFQKQFNIRGVDGDELQTVVAWMLGTQTERIVKARAGGRN